MEDHQLLGGCCFEALSAPDRWGNAQVLLVKMVGIFFLLAKWRDFSIKVRFSRGLLVKSPLIGPGWLHLFSGKDLPIDSENFKLQSLIDAQLNATWNCVKECLKYGALQCSNGPPDFRICLNTKHNLTKPSVFMGFYDFELKTKRRWNGWPVCFWRTYLEVQRFWAAAKCVTCLIDKAETGKTGIWRRHLLIRIGVCKCIG